MQQQGGLFPSAPSEGAIIGGKYKLVRKISEGGGGIVWEAQNAQGDLLALKFLKWSTSKSKKSCAEKFKNEFAILKSLSHPNIAQIFDFGIDAETYLYYFTTELLTAGDLKKMIGAQIPVVEELMMQALRALEYLRSNKLLHLDIKPQNLLLRHDGEHPELAVIDFGLAAFRPPDRPGGTANYLPPELTVRRLEMFDEIPNYPEPDHRSDLYSLGVTFYYLLTGIQPFLAIAPDGYKVDTLATLERHLEHNPPPPSSLRSEIPSYLDRIVMKLMSRHPDDRYPSALIAAQALQHASPIQHAPESQQSLLAYIPKEGRLVGRHKESQIIERTLTAIAEGTAHIAPIVCIAGTRGVGRTRLMMYAKPFAQQLEMDVTVFDDADASESCIGAEEINSATARTQPHLILIDDLDKYLANAPEGFSDQSSDYNPADGPTISKILSLIRKLRFQQRLTDAIGQKLALIFTINTDRYDTKRALMELHLDESLCRTIELKNFTDLEISEYLTALLGEKPDTTVVDQLKKCTDGNPLFITERLEEMVAKGLLFSLAGRPDAKTLKTIGVDFSQMPPSRSLAETVLWRLNCLTDEAKSLALLMACWQRPVSADELKETFGSQNTSHEILLLVSAGLIRKNSSDGRFSFVNSLAPQIICNNASPDAVARRHDSIAHYLMRQRKIKPDELDTHVAYGTRIEKRIPALKRLAEKAMDEHKPLGAAAHFESLLGILHKDDTEARADALAGLGNAYERARRLDEAGKAYRELAALKASVNLKMQFKIKSAEKLGLMAMRRRNLNEARKFFSDAINLLKDSPSMITWRIRLENFLAGVDMRGGRIEEAVERFERTAKIAERKLCAKDRAAITNNELGEAVLRSGKVEKALDIIKNELKNAKEAADNERMASRHYLLGDAYRHDSICKFDKALEHYEQALKLSSDNKLIELQVRVRNGLGNLNLKMKKPEKALEHYGEGLRLAQQIESETTSIEIMIGMGLTAQQMAKPDNTIEYFEAALEFSRGPRGTYAGLIRRYSPAIYVSLGDAYYQKHEFEKAERYLKEALILDGEQTLTPDIRYSLYGTYIEIFLERGDVESANKYLPTLGAIVQGFPPAKLHFESLNERIRCRKALADLST